MRNLPPLRYYSWKSLVKLPAKSLPPLPTSNITQLYDRHTDDYYHYTTNYGC